MTKDDLIFRMETLQPLEFTYKGKLYNMTFDKVGDGTIRIRFGRLFEEQTYSSFGELMNTAKIDNHFFKDMLDIL